MRTLEHLILLYGAIDSPHKTVEIKVFLHYFACWWKDPDPELYKKITDPDPEHYLKH